MGQEKKGKAMAAIGPAISVGVLGEGEGGERQRKDQQALQDHACHNAKKTSLTSPPPVADARNRKQSYS